MIEIYNRSPAGKNRLIFTVNTYGELFRHLYERELTAFGHTESDCTTVARTRHDYQQHDFYHTLTHFDYHRFCYTAIDNGRLVTPDRLVGLYREANRNALPFKPKRHGSRKRAYGKRRRLRTTNERRQVLAQQDVDHAPPVRCARNLHNLPDSYDDVYTHCDRSWKHQCKRKHQWK